VHTLLPLLCALAPSFAGSPSGDAPGAEAPHHLGLSVGSTIAQGSAPFGGGGALRLFGGTRLAKLTSIEVGLSYVDYFSRGAGTNAGAALALSVEARFEAPVAGEWLRVYGRGGPHYALGITFFRMAGGPDERDRVRGFGLSFGGGLRFRLWRNPRDGTEMHLGAEIASMWTFPGGDHGPTVSNLLCLPLGVSWR
jgi:hypothetical protein